MTVLVDDDFGTDTSANYGINVTVTGGTMTLDEDGLALHTTEITGTEIWARYIIETVNGTNAGFAIGDGSGNGFFIQLGDLASNLETVRFVEYDTYTTYAGNDDASSNVIGAIDRTKQHGVTWDLTNNEVRIWDDVTADEPTAIGTWDGVGPDVGPIDYGALGQTQDGNYLGYGTWDTGTPADELTLFAAGNIGAAGGGAVSHLLTLGVGS